MPNKTISCKNCKATFEFTEREQEFYAEKGFQNEPQKCPTCRAEQKERMKGQRGGGGGRSDNRSGGGGFGRPQREMFDAICAECGVKTQVPFKPNGEKPVYCKDCFRPNNRY